MPPRPRTILAALLAVAALAPVPPVAAAPVECPFEIGSNKPFVQVTVNGSAPQWFILDSGCSGGSVIAKECADRLGLAQTAPRSTHLGAGAGVSVGVSTTPNVTLGIGADTLTSAGLRVFPLAHVTPFEGRALDGLLGEDFLGRHVVEIDYARRRLRILDPDGYAPPRGATVVPITLDYGLAIAHGSITPAGGAPIPCRFIVDTGVRTTLILFHPFSQAHGFLDSTGSALTMTVGGGAGGETRGDLTRLASLSLGTLAFARPVALYSRDTVGVFAGRDPDGIVGGELLRRCRVTFDYPHERLVLEPYPGPAPPFEYDMSGLFLVSDGDAFDRIRVFSVAARTPAAEAGFARDDEILAIDGRSAAALGLEGARALLREPGRYRVRVARGTQALVITLRTRRLA